MARRRTGPGLARAAAFLLSATLLCSPALCAVADGLSGVWEGTLDRGDRHQAIALVFRPEGSSWTGLWYLDGFESGVLEAIRLEGSSLRFRSLTVSFEGSLAGDQLTLSATVKNGGTFPFVVKHTSRDAARLPSSVRPEGPAGGEKPKPRDVAPDSVYLAHAVPAGEPPSL